MRAASPPPAPAGSLVALVRSDFAATCAMDPARAAGPGRTLDVLTQLGFLALVLYRVSSAAHRRGHRVLARLLLILNTVLFNCEIYPQVVMGPGATITHPLGVAIGAGTVIGRDVRLHGLVRIGTAGYEDGRPDGFPVIGDGCRLFDHCMLFGPIEIGAGARIGANALVLRPVPAGAVVLAPVGDVRPPTVRSSAAGAAGGNGHRDQPVGGPVQPQLSMSAADRAPDQRSRRPPGDASIRRLTR